MNAPSSITPQDVWDLVADRVEALCQPVLTKTTGYLEPVANADQTAPALPRLEGYRVVRELGHGGMGVVYLAIEQATGTPRAIKTLLGDARLDPKLRERFLREAEAGARLHHPNIVQAHGLRLLSGIHCLIMEFVEGQTLADRLHEPLPQAQAARWAQAMARALQVAHDAGVVHRDLKPGNVLLAADSSSSAIHLQPKIADFGLARLLDAPTETTTGRVIGTFPYMAPEQARGDKNLMGPNVDIYGLGAILYAMLTRRPPYEASTPVAILKQVTDPTCQPVRPGRLNPEVSPALEAICLKCLEKDPASRYLSANELASDLDRYLGNQPVKAPRWTRVRAFRQVIARNPTISSLVAAVVLAVVIGAGVSFWLYLQTAQALATSSQRLYTQTVQNAVRLGQTEPEEALALLQDDERCPPELRSFDWSLLTRRFAPPRQLAGHEGVVFAVACSTDGRRMATAGEDGICLWDLPSGGLRRRLVRHRGNVTALCFRAGGEGLLASAGADGRIALWDPETGNHLGDLLSMGLAPIHSLAISPDGKRLAAGGHDRIVRLWDLESRNLLREMPGHVRTICALAFSPDGKTLVSGGGNARTMDGAGLLGIVGGGEVISWRMNDFVRQDVTTSEGSVAALAFSPQGDHLAIASMHSGKPVALYAVNATGYRPETRFKANLSHGICLAFSPDGKYLAIGCPSDWTTLKGDPMASVRVHDLGTGTCCRLRGHPIQVHGVAFAPGPLGRDPLLASVGCAGSVQLCPLPGNCERLELSPTGMTSTCGGSLSADGHRLLVADKREAVLWGLGDQPTQLRRLRGEGHPLRRVALSPDGLFAATSDAEGSVRLWNLSEPGSAPTVHKYRDVLPELVFSGDGQTLLGGGDDGVLRAWSVQGGKVLGELAGHGGPITRLATAGRYLISGGDASSSGSGGEVLLWETATAGLPRLVGRMTAPDGLEEVGGLAFSPDEKTLATGHVLDRGRTGRVRLWDVRSRKLQSTWQVKEGAVWSLAFSPDGRTLLGSTSPDRRGDSPSVLRIWELSGEERLTLRGGSKMIHSLTFAREAGNRLAAASYDGAVIVWEASSPRGR